MSDQIAEPLLLPREAAAMLRIDPKTLSRWARDGKQVGEVKLPSGQRRYRADAIRKILEGE